MPAAKLEIVVDRPLIPVTVVGDVIELLVEYATSYDDTAGAPATLDDGVTHPTLIVCAAATPTFRTRELLESAKYTFPDPSTASPHGYHIVALVAKPPSPE